ncbi:hypothetical protein ACFQVC_17005 [Streptomyces monticola]|uniref:Uncharacterized protein n=1 Tax=Streptomyces monticola TaxID=2666263 RepID=A0ABW2JJL6_9ACTN
MTRYEQDVTGGRSAAADEHVEIRLIATNPDAARRVAQVLRGVLDCDEPRSYPTGREGDGTRLHMTADTPAPHARAAHDRGWLADSHSQAGRTHPGETV